MINDISEVRKLMKTLKATCPRCGGRMYPRAVQSMIVFATKEEFEKDDVNFGIKRDGIKFYAYCKKCNYQAYAQGKNAIDAIEKINDRLSVKL
jgi:ribosomal protein L37E